MIPQKIATGKSARGGAARGDQRWYLPPSA
jgi:hypothetical protein